MAINKAETFSKKVNKTIEIIIDQMILRICEFHVPDKVQAKITGITGKTHGAKTLSIQARKDTIIRIIEIE